MNAIVKSKNIKISTKYDLEKSIGNYYSEDRFYTLINQYIDMNLSKKSRTLSFIVKYLYKSKNYKHDSSIANGRDVLSFLLDMFCIFSFIVFIALIFATFGVTIFSTIKPDISGVTEILQQIFFKNGGAPMLILAIIFGIIGISWLVMYFQIRKKNEKLSLKDYVLKKVGTILKLRWLIKSKDKINNQISKKNKTQIFFIDNFELQGSASARWINLQLINLLISIFDDFNLIFKFNNISEDEFNELKKIINVDFKNLEISN